MFPFIDSIDFLDGYIVGVTSQKELSELFIERRDLSRMSFDKFAVNDIELIDLMDLTLYFLITAYNVYKNFVMVSKCLSSECH